MHTHRTWGVRRATGRAGLAALYKETIIGMLRKEDEAKYRSIAHPHQSVICRYRQATQCTMVRQHRATVAEEKEANLWRARTLERFWSPDGARQRAIPVRLLFHPAKFSGLKLRTWCLVDGDPSLSVLGLARFLGVSRNYFGRTLKRLAKHGFLLDGRQRQDPDSGIFQRTRWHAVSDPNHRCQAVA